MLIKLIRQSGTKMVFSQNFLSRIEKQNFSNGWFLKSDHPEQINYIKKTLKVYKTLKMKYLKKPKLDVKPKKTPYNLFYKDIQEKKDLTGATDSYASPIILREWK